MKKIVYFMRHSEVLKGIDYEFNSDCLQLVNEKNILSSNGEELARKASLLDEFNNLDIVVSSNYVRAMATAKYFVDKNNCDFVVSDLFGERKHGVKSWSELPEDFEKKQFFDMDFKVGDGESLNEVKERMLQGLNILLEHTSLKKILVVGHATAIASLLSNWCNITYGGEYTFKDKVIFNRGWNYLECFKLEFDGDKLINVENLNIYE